MPELSQLASDGVVLYVIVAGLVMADAVFPLAPSETLLLTGGVLVAAGEVSFVPLVIAGALGAVTGHLLLYAIGAHAGPALVTKVLRSQNSQQLLEKAGRSLERRPWLLIVADFVPWGRTVFMFSAGALRIALHRFLTFTALAAIVWATFFATVGFVGGSVFDSTWHSLAVSMSAVLVIGLIGELLQRHNEARRTSVAVDCSPNTEPTALPNMGG